MSLDPVSRLDGKVAVITGGLGAIGYATARRLAALGATCVLLHRKGDDAAARAANEEELYDALAALERLDNVANAAFPDPCTTTPALDGFFIRDDVPADFASHFPGITTIQSDFIDPTLTNKEESQDQVYHVQHGLALVVALVPAVHPWGRALFSAHMAQHEILMLVAAPLLVLARPGAALLWALPQRTRRLAVALHPAWRRVTHPLAAFLLHSAVLWIWHVPTLFEAALASDALHWLQHLSFFGAACLYWTSLLAARPGPIGRGAAILSLFATCFQCGLLGALLTMAGHPWYGAYGIADQQLAGLAMWILASLAYTVAALPLVVAWLRDSERRIRLWEAEL